MSSATASTPHPDQRACVQALFRDNCVRGEASFGWRLDAFLQARQRRRVEAAATFAAGQRVLDVGAGLGVLARAAKRAGAHVTAVDSVPEIVERLRPDVDEAFVADADSLQLGGTFDRVLLIGVLDFVAEPQAVLARLAARLAPGGRFVLLVPTRTWLGRLYRLHKRMHGVRVRLFDASWCAREAGRGLRSLERPLPNNALLVLERPAPA